MITTYGMGSDGIFAQSVAGSGGSGGNSGGLVSLSGGAGPGGSGSVTVTNSGYIVTSESLVSSLVDGKEVLKQRGGRVYRRPEYRRSGGGDGGSASGMVSCWWW